LVELTHLIYQILCSRGIGGIIEQETAGREMHGGSVRIKK
jgi:hypothetical protein